MFDNKYSTNIIKEEIDLDIQLALWNLIDIWKNQGKKLDYLQVFNLSMDYMMGRMYLKIEHSQEVPRLKEQVYFNVYKPIGGIIWVVDDGEHAVMMFPNEY